MTFKEKYGPYALLAGGAVGIGAAYAEFIASQGVKLMIIDRDAGMLNDCCQRLSEQYGVECLPIVADLASDSVLDEVIAAVAQREVGILVYNAALADVGPFYKVDLGLDYELDKIRVNIVSPLALLYHFAKPMLRRGHGGIVLMSSGSGLQGSPYYSHYAATKAYNIVLGESLWWEFKPYNVDVLTCVAGMTLSPGVAGAVERGEGQHAVYQTPDEVVAEAMEMLGKVPSYSTGSHNRENQELLKALPREHAVAAIAQHAIDNFMEGSVPPQALD
ncbi:SDR family NAD(P)-dependent oxidoreductase [Spongiibacter sp.]|uniref:SDR family NAD(P)-dependent oxidoreductase n=1 Tax=Spongiibacter sp. TaxID=2024860 RepID=UPI00257FBF6D|nr:SDR family NAD(P)-dependent oxidoreductase [Spongiibacter sp.]